MDEFIERLIAEQKVLKIIKNEKTGVVEYILNESAVFKSHYDDYIDNWIDSKSAGQSAS